HVEAHPKMNRRQSARPDQSFQQMPPRHSASAGTGKNVRADEPGRDADQQGIDPNLPYAVTCPVAGLRDQREPAASTSRNGLHNCSDDALEDAEDRADSHEGSNGARDENNALAGARKRGKSSQQDVTRLEEAERQPRYSAEKNRRRDQGA